MVYFTGLFLIMFGVLAFYRIKWAVFLIVFLLPTYLIRFKVFGVPFTLLEGMILVLFGVWLFGNYKRVVKNLKLRIKHRKLIKKSEKPILIRYPFGKEISLLLIISYISVAVAGFSNEALGVWKAYFFEPLLLYIVVLNVFGRQLSLRGADATWQSLKKKKEFNQRDPSACVQDDILKFIILPLTSSAFVVSLFAIYQKITGNFIGNEFWANEATRRVTSFFEYPNAVGLFLGPIVLLMIGYIFVIARKSECDDVAIPIIGHCRIFHRIATSRLLLAMTGLTIVLSIFSIYFAKSEGALIAVVISLFLFGLLISKKIRYTLILFSIIIGVGIYFNQPIKEKIVQKVTLSDLSGEIRKQQWKETWYMITSSPIKFIFGAGLSGYQEAVKPFHQEGIFFNKDNDSDFRRKIVIYNDKYRAEHWQPVEIYKYPHNIFLNFWTELGLAGLLLFIWIIGKFVYLAFALLKKRYVSRVMCYSLIGAMLAIIIHGLVDVPYFKNDLAVMFWLIISLLRVSEIRRKIIIKEKFVTAH